MDSVENSVSCALSIGLIGIQPMQNGNPQSKETIHHYGVTSEKLEQIYQLMLDCHLCMHFHLNIFDPFTGIY